jgi:hypothetical protein
MRIQETSAIMKDAHIARVDHERHEHSHEGFFSRARQMMFEGSSKLTSTIRQMRSRWM